MYVAGETITREHELIAQAAGSSSVLLEVLALVRDARVRQLAIARPISPGAWTIRQPGISRHASRQEHALPFKLLNLSRLTSGKVIIVKLAP